MLHKSSKENNSESMKMVRLQLVQLIFDLLFFLHKKKYVAQLMMWTVLRFTRYLYLIQFLQDII